MYKMLEYKMKNYNDYVNLAKLLITIPFFFLAILVLLINKKEW